MRIRKTIRWIIGITGVVVAMASASVALGQDANPSLFLTQLNTSDEVAVFGCVEGEVLSISSRGVSRVAVDDSGVLRVSEDKARGRLEFSCAKVGTTQASVDREGVISTVIVRVGAPYELSEPPRVECGDLEGVEARVILGHWDGVHQVVVDSSVSSERRECIEASLRDFEWAASDRREFIRVARLRW